MNNSSTETIRITDISNAIEEICDFIVKNRILLRGDKSFYQAREGYLQPLSNDEAKRAVYSILPDELTMCLPSSQIDEVLRRLGKNPLQDFLTTKKLYHKTGGKQAEHFVLSFYPDKPEVSDKELVSIANEIVKANYPEFQSITAIHKDTNVRHTHTIINSVNAVNGKKFSQSNTDLNKVKTKTNEILKAHNMEVIKMSANNFTDKNNYNNEDNLDYLEIEENDDMYRDLINADEVIDRWNQNNFQNDDEDYTDNDDNNCCYYNDDTEEEQYLPVDKKKKRLYSQPHNIKWSKFFTCSILL